MENITEGILDFNTLEQTIFTTMCQTACQLIGMYLQEWDQIIMARRDVKEYRLVDTRRSTIKTRMGEVSYSRRYYKKKAGGYVYLLDEAMGMAGGCGLVSEALAEEIVIECTEKPFRRAAASINRLTGQAVSPMGVWRVFQQYGERLEGQERRLRELDLCGATGQLGNVESPVLFQEMDDVWLSMQKETRDKAGMPSATGGGKAGKKPLHVAIAYTGWREGKDGRYATQDKIAYASFGGTKEFAADFEMLLRHRYDMDGVQRRVANGDGAGWISAAAADVDAAFQLDPFHRSRAVLRAVSDKEGREAIFKAIKEKDVGRVLHVIYDMISKAGDAATSEKIGKLFGYFHSNKDNLLTWQERGLGLPAPPDGIVYRSLGVQEASNGDLIALRMKHKKGSWSPQGANRMAKALCFRHTIGLEPMMLAMPEPELTGMELAPEPLSVAKAPQRDGQGYDGTWLRASLPLAGAFVTNGRAAIRKLLSQRPVSDLNYM